MKIFIPSCVLFLLFVPKTFSQSITTPDFYMFLTDCKNVVSVPGNIRLKKNPLVTDEGDPLTAQCERIKSDVKCDYYGKDKKYYNSQTFKITFEGAPNLELQSPNGFEHYLIDTVNNTVASSNVTYLRPKNEKTGGLISKTCSGIYLTSTESQLLLDNQKK